MSENKKNTFTTWYVVIEGQEGFWGIYLTEEEAKEDLIRMVKKYSKYSWSSKFKVISKEK